MHYTKICKKMGRALKDMESFTDNTKSTTNFVYRYGVMTSSNSDEAILVALFDGATEDEIYNKRDILDRKFLKYTDARCDIEKDASGIWYGTYGLFYPFDTENQSGKQDGQNTKPLF